MAEDDDGDGAKEEHVLPQLVPIWNKIHKFLISFVENPFSWKAVKASHKNLLRISQYRCIVN
jgi:hypothetical protein